MTFDESPSENENNAEREILKIEKVSHSHKEEEKDKKSDMQSIFTTTSSSSKKGAYTLENQLIVTRFYRF